MSSLVHRFMRCSGVVAALMLGLGLVGCGDGGGTTTTAPAAVTTTEQTVTQSDIVLPSSVQVVTAR